MLTIWKFPIEIRPRQTVLLPDGAIIIAIQIQQDQPCIWAIVDPDQPKADRPLETFGTGYPIPPGGRRYIGTYQIAEGSLVFHVFEPVPSMEKVLGPKTTD